MSLQSLTGFRLLYGSALLLAPRTMLGATRGVQIDGRAVMFARVLGARQIAQALVISRRRSRGWVLGGAAVDAIHATTMALLAGVDRRRRTMASANVLTATALALAGVYEARRL